MREQLRNVEEWRRRKEEVEAELGRVWVEGGEELEKPGYLEQEGEQGEEEAEAQGEEVEDEEDTREGGSESLEHVERESIDERSQAEDEDVVVGRVATTSVD